MPEAKSAHFTEKLREESSALRLKINIAISEVA
jgi:hypothetical protein